MCQVEEAQSWKEHRVYSVVAAKSSEDGSARVQGYQGWRGQKMQTLYDHSYPFRCCWYCSSKSYASISAGQGEAGTLANCIYENMLTTLRKNWQGTKLLIMSRNKDTSLKVSAGILEGMADQYILQSWFSRTCSRQNVERDA